MKKIALSLVSVASTLFLTTASAATFPVLVINNTQHPMTINYHVCDAQKKMCSMVKEHSIDSVQSGKNRLSVLGELMPKMENFTISAAVVKDSNGKKIASLQKACDLPTKSRAIILDNHGSSSIECHYGS